MSTQRMTAIVGARISEFRRNMAEVNRTMRKTATNVVVNVVVNRYKLAQKRLDSIADKIRTLNTVGSNMAFGSLMAISPSIVPILAATVGAIASLGPMIGVLAGSTFALATAFGFAGLAAVAFAGVAIPTISQLFKENAKLNKEQQAARAEFDNMKKTWGGIVKDLQKPVLQAFGESMKITNKILQMSKPLFQSAADAMNNLLKALNTSLDSAPVKAFFDYMNKQAGPMFEIIGKSIGNFMQGFMSMMVAFGPLAESTAQGFLKMSENFATWAAGLSKSEKFQAFVNYVQENMPKIREIFRDFTAGLIYMFSAFGPLAADMMTGLQNLMARFKEWGATLSQNQQFQNFISYIRTNAPQVLTLIANLTDFLINMGIALAPLGEKILGIVNGFFNWLNRMMEIHPWLGQIIGGIIVMTGVLQATIPIITVIITMFSKFGAALLRNIAMYAYWTAQWVASTAVVYAKSIWVTAKFVANCALMAAKYAWFAAKVVAQAIWWTAQTTASLIAWGAKQLATLIASTAQMVARMAWTAAQFVAKYALMSAQAMIHAARMAAAWFIALGPVGWVIATVIALVALIIANWDKVKAFTQQAWTAIWNWIKDTWNKIKTSSSDAAKAIYQNVQQTFKNILSFLKGLGSSFLAAGKGLIEQMAKGIKNAAGKVLNEVKKIAQKARDYLPFSPAKVGPLSDIGNLNFGGPIAKSIKKARTLVSSSMSGLLSVARDMIEPIAPQMAFDGAVSGEQFKGLRSSINTSTPVFKKDKSSISTSNGQNQAMKFEIPVMVDGYEIARASVDYIDGMLGENAENKKVYNGVK